MNYDFSKDLQRRGTRSNKWDKVGELFGNPDALPMWVADTDFPCPRPVMEALAERIEHPVFGYSYPPDSLYRAIADRMREQHGWEIDPEWIVLGTGVISALYAALETVSMRGDEVIIQPPVYYPFFRALGDTGRQILLNPLVLRGGRYRIDFEQLESLFLPRTSFPSREPRIAALILCNPHNPVGRAWTSEEIGRIGDLCSRYGIILISDEIHCDLMVGDREHTVAASLSEDLAARTITLMSVNKTYNLPGLKTSFAVIPDEAIRKRFQFAARPAGSPNDLGLVALEAAIRDPDGYLPELIEYLKGNLKEFREGMSDIEGIELIEPEGTYLAWVDMRGLGLSDDDLAHFIVHEAGIAPDFGYAFGPGGQGFQRMNLGCTRATVREALARLQVAVRRLHP